LFLYTPEGVLIKEFEQLSGLEQGVNSYSSSSSSSKMNEMFTKCDVKGKWIEGFPLGDREYWKNPMYLLKVSNTSPLEPLVVRLRVESKSKEYMNIVMFGHQNQSVTVTPEDIHTGAVRSYWHTGMEVVSHSGKYRANLCTLDHMSLEDNKKEWIVVPGIYSPRGQGDFTLFVDVEGGGSSKVVEMLPIGSGDETMITTKLMGQWKLPLAGGREKYSSNPMWKLKLKEPTSLYFHLQCAPGVAKVPFINISLRSDKGQELLTSGPFTDAPVGTWTRLGSLYEGTFHIIVSTYDALAVNEVVPFTITIYSYAQPEVSVEKA